MPRTLLLMPLLFLVSTTGLAQSKFDGKWATERKQGPASSSDTDRERQQGVAQLELTVGGDGTTVKGTLSLGGLGGSLYTFDQGRVTGSKIYFRTLAGQSTYSTWYVELVDDNTVTLWSFGLDLVGNNVLDLVQSLPGTSPQPTAQPQTPAPPTQPTVQAVQAPQGTVPSCSPKSAIRCYMLHRAK